MSASTPTTAAGTSNTLTLIMGAAVALVVIVGLIVLVALGKLTWADAGPLIGALAGVHGGAALTAFVPR